MQRRIRQGSTVICPFTGQNWFFMITVTLVSPVGAFAERSLAKAPALNRATIISATAIGVFIERFSLARIAKPHVDAGQKQPHFFTLSDKQRMIGLDQSQ
jgi:hypothetical protein